MKAHFSPDYPLIVHNRPFGLGKQPSPELSHINKIRLDVLRLVLSYLDDPSKLKLRGTCSSQEKVVNHDFEFLRLVQTINSKNIKPFLATLGRFINLKFLNLSQQLELDESLLESIIKQCPNISELVLKNVPGVTDQTLSTVATTTIHLYHLDISHCDGVTRTGIEYINGCPHLKTINISWCHNIVFPQLNPGVKIIQYTTNEEELINAAIEGNIQDFSSLLEKGVLIDTQNKDGQTSLMIATCMADIPMVKFLLKKGAKMTEKDILGYTVFMYAILSGDQVTVDMMYNQGVNINERNHEGFTPVMLATLKGYNDILKFLISKGADINLQNKEGGTALIIAASYNNEEAVRGLLEAGADIHAKNNQGYTAATVAYKQGYDHIYNLILNWSSTGKSLYEGGCMVI